MRSYQGWNLAAEFDDPLNWLNLLNGLPESARLARVRLLIRELSVDLHQLGAAALSTNSEDESGSEEEGDEDEVDEIDDDAPREVVIVNAPMQVILYLTVRFLLLL